MTKKSENHSQQEPVMFGTLLKEKRKKARISQQEFADLMSVSRNTVVNWEADKSKPDYNLIPDLCGLFHIRLGELFRMEEHDSLSDLENRVVNNLRMLSPVSRKVIDKMVSAMLDEELRAKDQMMKETFGLFLSRPGTNAAGTGDYVPDEPPTYVFLRKNHINQRADGIAHVHGHSMEPVYYDGDDVYYRESGTASPGEDVIVDTDDGAVIKRVGDNHTLYSVNPDPRYRYPDKNDQKTLVIRGVVLGTVHSSDKANKEENGTLEELFVDEIREFNEEHHIDDLE